MRSLPNVNLIKTRKTFLKLHLQFGEFYECHDIVFNYLKFQSFWSFNPAETKDWHQLSQMIVLFFSDKSWKCAGRKTLTNELYPFIRFTLCQISFFDSNFRKKYSLDLFTLTCHLDYWTSSIVFDNKWYVYRLREKSKHVLFRFHFIFFQQIDRNFVIRQFLPFL